MIREDVHLAVRDIAEAKRMECVAYGVLVVESYVAGPVHLPALECPL